jgi:DNA ligase (NAD+)
VELVQSPKHDSVKSMASKIEKLVSRIEAAKAAYYNDNREEVGGYGLAADRISDREYDALFDELAKLDPKNPAIVGIGAEPVSNWEKYAHKVPLGSLDKCNTEEEFLTWASKYCTCNEFIALPKYDGLTVSLVYENGKLVMAASRGSGTIGEAITANVIKMAGVPLMLPKKISATIRGEILLSKDNHNAYFPDYSNARNAASGISRRYDGEGSDKLNVVVYSLQSDDYKCDKLEEQLHVLSDNLGFNAAPYWTFISAKDAYAFKIKFQKQIREKFAYELDGLVVSCNDMEEYESHGFHSSRPRAAIAAKFDNVAKETTIRAIEWGVGGQGRITPVAIFDEVDLVGVKITNASIYNPSAIEELGIDIGARVLVERANDVIPKIVECIQAVSTVVKPPTNCPSCDAKLIMNGENLQCPNTDECPAQLKGRILNWLNGLNVLELGSKLVDQLVDTGMVKTPADLYRLTIDDLATLDRMGKKSATNVYNSLWSITELPLEMLLGSLSIPLAAASTIKMVIAAGYDTLDKIMSASREELAAVKGLGGVKSKLLFEGLRKNTDTIRALLQSGLKVKDRNMSGKLNGVKICITGRTEIKRDDLRAMIENAGGVFQTKVDKTTAFLCIVDPENSTTAKAVAARKNGTKLISEEQLLGMIEG